MGTTAQAPATTYGSWSGRSGVERLRASREVRVAVPEAFRAETRGFHVDGADLFDWRSTPVVMTRPARVPHEPRAATLAVVIAGEARCTIDGRTVECGRGALYYWSGDHETAVEYVRPTRLIGVIVPMTQLPDAVRRALLPPTSVLPRSVSSTGFVTLLEQMLAACGPEGPSVHTVRALRALVASVLLEHVDRAGVEEQDLRQRILDHIEEHLGDPELGPRTIAAEFAVSLRWVHAVFNTGETSLARHIRERRVDSVAELVRTDRRVLRVGALAAAHGFAGRDQLTRAFRARFGMTVNDYQELAARGGRLPESGAVAPVETSGAA